MLRDRVAMNHPAKTLEPQPPPPVPPAAAAAAAITTATGINRVAAKRRHIHGERSLLPTDWLSAFAKFLRFLGNGKKSFHSCGMR